MQADTGLRTKVRSPGNSAIGACEGSDKALPGLSRQGREDGEFVVEDKVVIGLMRLRSSGRMPGPIRFALI